MSNTDAWTITCLIVLVSSAGVLLASIWDGGRR